MASNSSFPSRLGDISSRYDDVVIGAGARSSRLKGVPPFMIAQLVVLFLMVLFPGLVTIPAKWFGG